MFQTKPTAPVNKQSVIIRILSEAICSLYEYDRTTHKRHSEIGFTNARLSSLQGQRRFWHNFFWGRSGMEKNRPILLLLHKGFRISRLNGYELCPSTCIFVSCSRVPAPPHIIPCLPRDVSPCHRCPGWWNLESLKRMKKRLQKLLSTPGVF